MLADYAAGSDRPKSQFAQQPVGGDRR